MLRDYQSALVAELSRALTEQRSVCLQLPTGGGKTHIAAHYIQAERRRGKRVWVVCHRREIVRQTSESLEQLGVAHGVVAAGTELCAGWQVQVCSIGTLRRMLDELPAPDLIIWDEAHHIVAKSWSALRERMSNARHLGLTATPVRLDGKGLDGFFDALICGPTTADLIAAGHLATYRLFAPTIPDLRDVELWGGDYAKSQLTARMSGDALVGDVIEHYRRLAFGSRAVAFAVSIEASRATVARFNSAGIPASHIDGSTPYAERDAAIADLEAGRIRVLSNVEVFTEGFDLPAIDAVILLRPTRSLALYRQMVGRGLRTAPGKRATIILDHAGLAYEHDLPDDPVEWSLAGVRERPRVAGGARIRRCPECSAVHGWASACTECGHTYVAADRTINEVYGELMEISRPSGNVHPKGFPLGTFESRGEFAQRIGRSKPAVNKMAARGLPCGPNGWVHIVDGQAWLRAEETKRQQRVTTTRKQRQPHQPLRAGDSVTQFADRMGISSSTVRSLIVRGLPVHADGSIDTARSQVWLEQNRVRWLTRPPTGFEAPKAFARRVGLSGTGGLRGLKKAGLPIEANGLVKVDAALAWYGQNAVVLPKGRASRATRPPEAALPST